MIGFSSCLQFADKGNPPELSSEWWDWVHLFKGIKGIYVITVNDTFVVKAWKTKVSEHHYPCTNLGTQFPIIQRKITEDKETPVHFVSDDKSSFVSALGLVFDGKSRLWFYWIRIHDDERWNANLATPVLGGPRAKRFVLVVDNGKVEHIFVEKEPSQLDVTAADHVLQKLWTSM